MWSSQVMLCLISSKCSSSPAYLGQFCSDQEVSQVCRAEMCDHCMEPSPPTFSPQPEGSKHRWTVLSCCQVSSPCMRGKDCDRCGTDVRCSPAAADKTCLAFDTGQFGCILHWQSKCGCQDSRQTWCEGHN